MAGFKRGVVINKPIEVVFDFATNLDNASKFLPGVTRIEMLTEGGMKSGAKSGFAFMPIPGERS